MGNLPTPVSYHHYDISIMIYPKLFYHTKHYTVVDIPNSGFLWLYDDFNKMSKIYISTITLISRYCKFKICVVVCEEFLNLEPWYNKIKQEIRGMNNKNE